MISYLAKENCIYQGRYHFQKLQGEMKKVKKTLSLLQQWDEIHQIYLELMAGERCIRKAADGKWYAVKI